MCYCIIAPVLVHAGPCWFSVRSAVQCCTYEVILHLDGYCTTSFRSSLLVTVLAHGTVTAISS